MSLLKLAKRFKKMDIYRLGTAVLVDTKNEVLRLNKEQLLEGKNSLGKNIEPKYAPNTLKRKLKQGRSGVVDLYDKGDYQAAMKLDIDSKTKHKIYSSNDKAKLIEAKYSRNGSLYGLNNESLVEYRGETFMPQLRQRFKEYMNGKE